MKPIKLGNGRYIAPRPLSEVKAFAQECARVLFRLEIAGLIGLPAYRQIASELSALNWYINQKVPTRRRALAQWDYSRDLGTSVRELNELTREGVELAFDWLSSKEPSGLIADALPEQQQF